MEKMFYNNIFPIISFNSRLSGIYGELKRTRQEQELYFISSDDSKKLKIISDKDIIKPFEIHEYVDFTNLIKAINNKSFHLKDNLDSLFKIRCKNYLIGGNSFMNQFILEMLKLFEDTIKLQGENLKKYFKKPFSFTIFPGKKILFDDIKKNKNLIKNDNKNNAYNNQNIIVKKMDLRILSSKKNTLGLPLSESQEKNNIIRPSSSKNNKKKKIFLKINPGNNPFSPSANEMQTQESKEDEKIINSGNLNKNENKNNLNIIYGKKMFPYLINKESMNKDSVLFEGLRKKKNITDLKKELGNEFYPNVFDLLFSNKRIGNNNNIEVYENDISEILNKYNPENFEKLVNINFQTMGRPKNWCSILNPGML